MKKTLLAILALVTALLLGLFVWLYSSLDSIVKAGIEKYGSEITQVSIQVDKVKLSPTDGQGIISGLTIGNPKGFKTDHALSVGSIEVGVEPSSIAKDVVLIHKIGVVAPDINYEASDAGSNFDVIQRNVDQYLGLGSKEKEPGKKMIVETFFIQNAKVSYSPAIMQGKTLELSLPDIELHNIGKSQGGVTSGELTKAIIDALKGQLTKSVERSLKSVTESAGKAAKGIGKSVKGLFK